MDAVRPSTDEPSRKKAKSQGCAVDGCLSVAKKRDPNTGFWYCPVCFRDARPDLDADSMRCQLKSKPDRRIVGKAPLPVIPRGQPTDVSRCFVCHSTKDIGEFVCGMQRSQSCGVARLCPACRAARDGASCFSCFGKYASGRCYRCDERCDFDGERRLCLSCRREEGAIQCYFCRRHHSSVELRWCDSADCNGRSLTCASCFDVQGGAFCRSCFARDWKGRCYRCREKWAQRSQSHYCRKCHSQLFQDPINIAIAVFSSLPPREWYSRWGPAWFHRKRVGMQIPYVSNGMRLELSGSSIMPWRERVVIARCEAGRAKEPEDIEYFTLDEETCLAIAKEVPTWGRHLQRLCGKFEGQVSLVQNLLVNIMGCQFRYEGEALTSRWEGGLVPGFCSHDCRQLTRDDRCEHQRCHALQAPRHPGKLCFMELVEAVAGALPRRLAIGDSIRTASWGEFVVMDDFSKIWLNDYSSYFSEACGSSWDRAVAIYVGGYPGLPRGSAYRAASTYTCWRCGEDRAAGREIHALCSEVKFAIHTQCPGVRTLICLECSQKDHRKSLCRGRCGLTCRGFCANSIPVGAQIQTGPEYIWGEYCAPRQSADDDA